MKPAQQFFLSYMSLKQAMLVRQLLYKGRDDPTQIQRDTNNKQTAFREALLPVQPSLESPLSHD
jgi:hypothetical protein